MRRHDIHYICDLIRSCAGIELDAKEYLMEQRLQPLCYREKLDTIEQLVAVMRSQTDGDLLDRVVDAFTNNETSFFRDVRPFEVLSSSVLPEIFERVYGGRVNIWSAGCSAGQEAYSIAMSLKERFTSAQRRRVRILASDISATMIALAKNGVYSDYQISRGLAPEFKDKYFGNDGGLWRVNRTLASMIDFRKINFLALPPDLPRMDVVFLRNVLIYFSEETRMRVLTQIHEILRPGGYLFLGVPETNVKAMGKFERIIENKTMYFRVPNPSVATIDKDSRPTTDNPIKGQNTG